MEEIAAVYARSLFEVAHDQDKLDVVREQLGAFADALNETRDLQVFLFSPYFSTKEKEEGLERVVSDADPVILNVLKLLPVHITSAVELDNSIVKQLGDRISEQTDRKVDVSAQVDPDILGGIVVRVGNSILDASVRNRLEQLRRQVARA